MGIYEQLNIAFASGAFPGDRIRLFRASGREALSALFEMELLIAREEGGFSEDELDQLLDAPCAVALGPDPGDIVHGILRRIEVADTSGTLAPRYLATMVPTVFLLTLARTSRLFQNMSVPDIVSSILTQYGLAAGRDFRLNLSGSYAPLEYVVQYEESDWDFIQRWLEAKGIYYWFEHSSEGEALVISDSNSFATPIAAPSQISYRSQNDLATDGISTVWEWILVKKRLPARVAVFDYNYRTPHVRLVAQAPVDAAYGFGSVMRYNEHFKTVAEGEATAKLRAERLLSERRVFSGWTDCARFRVGQCFKLADHYDSANDGEYLITAIDHSVGMSLLDHGQDAGSHTQEVEHYKARFEAIPLATQYRPDLVTPRPVVQGVMHGHVDEDSAGEYAQIDEQGRYKVRLPFDSGNQQGGLASRWIRMAQSYSGTNYGSHYPLHRGAEVLVAHIDGHPDRPVIVGTVPHAHTTSPVTSVNLTQSVVHTPSGIRIELEDLQEG